MRFRFDIPLTSLNIVLEVLGDLGHDVKVKRDRVMRISDD